MDESFFWDYTLSFYLIKSKPKNKISFFLRKKNYVIEFFLIWNFLW